MQNKPTPHRSRVGTARPSGRLRDRSPKPDAFGKDEFVSQSGRDGHHGDHRSDEGQGYYGRYTRPTPRPRP
jgi:hypothetical protein